MISNWWVSTLSIVEIAGQLAVLVALCRCRLLTRWPSVFTSCLMNLCCCVPLLILTRIPHHYVAYFYLYWSGVAVQAVLRLWMCVDILRSVPAIWVIPPRIAIFVPTLGFVLAAGAWLLTRRDELGAASLLVTEDLLFDRSVNFALVTVLAVLLAAIYLLHLGWDAHGAYITYGVLFYAAGKLVVSIMLSLGPPPIRTLANGVDSVVYIITLAFWFFCFTGSLPQPQHVAPYPSAALKTILKADPPQHQLLRES